MSQQLAWCLQILILGTGIYFALRFLRRTRGGGILRGLLVAMLFGAAVLWTLVRVLGLEELGHILEGITGFVFVILVILFQPELRRGIARLGDHPLLRPLLQPKRQETLAEVAQSAIAMAKRRRGALIAFERESSLDAYVDAAVRVDGEVSRLLLESIFHPGGALHDGAVVIRGDRIAAATCLFPLTESTHVGHTTGTRHRAALGLTEETDAVVLVVSEETGAVSICQGGRIERAIPAERVEDALREALGSRSESDQPEGEAAARAPGAVSRARRGVVELVTRDLPRKAAALALAAVVLWIAHRDLRVDREYTLRVVALQPGESGARPGELAVRLPGADYRLVAPEADQVYRLEVSGTRAQVDALGPMLSGELAADPDRAGQAAEVALGSVYWTSGEWSRGVGLSARWKSAPPPQVFFERVESRSFTLRPEHLSILADGLDPRFRPDPAGARFYPPSVEVLGPAGELERLDTPSLPLRLAPLELGPEDTAFRREWLPLAPELVEARFTLVGIDGTVQVTVPIVDALRPLATLEVELQLVDLSGGGGAARWRSAEGAARVRLALRGVGLLPAGLEPGSAAFDERVALLREVVRRHLRVFADTSGLADDAQQGRVEARWTLAPEWRAEFERAAGELEPRARLELALESEPDVLLLRVPSGESGASANGGEN